MSRFFKERDGSARPARRPDRRLVGAMMALYFSAFLLISLQTWPIDLAGLGLSLAVPALIYVSTLGLPHFFPADKLLLAIANFLCALGVLILYITDRGAGTSRGLHQAVYYGVGVGCMAACILLVRYVRRWGALIPLIFVGALALMALPLFIGTEQNGATNWIAVGGTSLQPSEIVKLALLLVVAYYLGRRRMLPWLIFAVACLGLLMLQKDLGTALIYYATTLMMFYAATSKVPLTLAGLAGGCGAAVLGYGMFAHVKRRVAIWQNPWLYYESSGYQLVKALIAIASGGLLGVGVGRGETRAIPVYFADCMKAVICEKFGFIFGALVLVMYVILILRGTSIATGARRSFHALLAIGATVMLGVQTFVIIGGVLKLIPLTGVTMPFVSYGGTSLVSCMCLIGLLQGVASVNQDDINMDYRISRSQAEEALLPEADGR